MSVMCQKCEDEPSRCEDCSTKNDEFTAEVLSDERLKRNEKHWDDFLWATRLIGERREGLIDVNLLTAEQIKRAIALLEKAGFTVSDRWAVIEAVRYNVLVYLAN